MKCPICDSEPVDGSMILAKVLIEAEPLDRKEIVPEGFLCQVCGFRIDPSERYLARHFVSANPQETAEAYLADIPR